MRRDRKELAFLGALLLGWGLVLAPLIHQLASHAHGHAHAHRPAVPDEAPHGQGALEHGAAQLQSGPVAPTLVLVLVAMATVAVSAPSAPALTAWPRVEKSQGP